MFPSHINHVKPPPVPDEVQESAESRLTWPLTEGLIRQFAPQRGVVTRVLEAFRFVSFRTCVNCVEFSGVSQTLNRIGLLLDRGGGRAEGVDGYTSGTSHDALAWKPN